MSITFCSLKERSEVQHISMEDIYTPCRAATELELDHHHLSVQ